MRIENLRSEKNGNMPKVAAMVTWEDCDRPAQEIYFGTGEAFAQDLTCNPHAFLVASIIPALHYGEERIFIDAEICPELRQGLITAMAWIRHWYYDEERKPVRIEAKTRSDILSPQTPERAGFFFSGGIDSLATLRANRLNFPLEHPASIKDGLLVYGLEVEMLETYEYVVSFLSNIACEASITLIPVYTNVRNLNENWAFWEHKWEGAVFSAIGHAFSRRLTAVSIASTYDIPNVQPLGSHPLIDPNYSSSDLQIRHDGITLSRLSRTRLVADWEVALQNLRVCNRSERYRPDMLNCGRCEKCVRTMLALLALGKLDKTRAFPANDVSEELVRSAVHLGETTFPLYGELIPPLMEKGRHDLVRIIEHKMAVYLDCEPGWRGRIKRFDRKRLHGALSKFRESIASFQPKLAAATHTREG
jgi:hypothetical protein